jgi:cytochrome P450
MASHEMPPGPDGLPFIGNTLHWARDTCGFQQRCAEQYGPVVAYEINGMDAFMLSDPDDIEQVLVHESERFPKHRLTIENLSGTVGQGLVTSDGNLWERQREAIQPVFQMSHIKHYADIMVSQTMERMADWEDGMSLEMESEMTQLTLNILVEAMFGRDIDPNARGFHDAVEALHAPFESRNQAINSLVPEWVPLPFRRREQKAIAHIDEQIYDIMADRRQNGDERDDLLSMLVHAEAEMTDKQVRDELMTMLLAGHETTALTLTYVWHLLSRASNVEARLRDELATTLDGDRPTIGQLPALTYTENIVKEALRLYPPAYQIPREPIEDIEIGGYTIPEGAMIILPMWVMHRDTRFWDDPELFRPERWDGETDRPDFAYFPFAGGPRRCLGRRFAMTEAQLILATVVQKYTFDRQYEDLSLSPAVTLRPKNPVEMTARSVE